MRQPVKKKSARRTKALKGDGYHHGDLKASLIETAIEMLKTISPEHLSLRELARKAGVSAAAPYRHFKDRRDILAAISTQGFELKYRLMVEGIRQSKGDPVEMYYQCALAYFKMGMKHPQHFKLMFSSDVCPTDEFPELMISACKTFMLLKQMIIMNQKNGSIGPGDANHKAMNCWCVVNGFTTLYVEERLGWLGVDQESAKSALKSLMHQYLVGNQEGLAKSTFGFTPFMTPEADHKKKELLDQIDAEVLAVFDKIPNA